MRYALVTGGARGIGREIALKLASEGNFVLINYRSNDEEAHKTLSMIKEQGGQGALLKFDVANREETDEILGQWIEANKETPIQILVNNAGIRKDTLLIMMGSEDWDSVLDTNLGGFYNVTKLVISPMLVKKYGRVINIVSLSGLKGLPGQVNYSAAKAGTIGATKALAQEVGRRGVTVNAIAPGFIKTEMTQDLKEEELKKLIPLNRFGEAKEVAELVAFIASEKSSYITGEVININGGLYS
jgi:3-oxoacyl-[acyl-carrier protein] reductase